MAKNWKVGEAVRAIMSGNKEDILDIGRRYPLFNNLASQTNEAGAKLLDCIPDYVTARKVESVLKGDANTDSNADAEVETEEVEEKVETKAKGKKSAKASKKDEDDPYEGKSPKELYDLCKDRGLKVKAKQPAEIYEKALRKDDLAKAKVESKAEVDEDDDWGEEDDAVEEKKPAKKSKKKEEEDDDDDWDI